MYKLDMAHSFKINPLATRTNFYILTRRVVAV